ncbi:MAG: sugar ABC transporter permease [Thermus sp.]|nr:sugar ABC transporter permease [Thermus sp.]
MRTKALRGFHYFVVSLSMLIAPVGVGLIWKMILHPELGILAYLFGGVDYFGDPRLALLSLALVDVWQQVSFVTILLLAGLRSLPKDPLEAAYVDGATPLQAFLRVTLPLLGPVMVVVVILQTITEIRTYDLVYVLTRGGPGTATDLVSYYIYHKAFLGLDLSGAAAMSYILLLLTLALVGAYYRALTRF